RIRQLGVAHWVYPAATHTRLEHSIGALTLVQRLLAAANLNASNDAKIPPEYIDALRIATLCHDIGHGVMSHVSENALAYVEAAEEIGNEFTEAYSKEAALGEINAFFLVGSPAFADLLKIAQHVTKEIIKVSNLPDFIQKCIIGKKVDSKYPLLHQ